MLCPSALPFTVHHGVVTNRVVMNRGQWQALWQVFLLPYFDEFYLCLPMADIRHDLSP